MTAVPLDVVSLYPRVQQFYAAQMQRLDAKDIEGYAQTFTEDAEFAHTPGRPPSRTRTGITEDLKDFHQRFVSDPMQRRHMVNMINLEPGADGAVQVTAYCMVVKVRPGEEPVFVSCVMHDVLVEEGGELLNRSRHVSYD
jgi:actinorhodin biosynthesis protein ActVIA